MQKIYIAGPDVFKKDAIAIGENFSNITKEYGYEPLFPLDNEVDFSQAKHTIAQEIFQANIALIEQADIVVANLNSFRGMEADTGTVWECGYAKAKGKKVYGYLSRSGAYLDQFQDKREMDGLFWDDQNRFIEDFDYPLNLMVACSCDDIIEGSFRDVLEFVHKSYTFE